MKEFLFVFRRDFVNNEAQPSPAQMQGMMKDWQNWMGSLAAQNKLANAGNRLTQEGRIVRPGSIITDGPYVEIKEGVGGYIIIRAESIGEAAELAKGCPVLAIGGNVEVRPIVMADGNA